MGAIAAPDTDLRGGLVYSVKKYGAKGDLRTASDLSATNGSPIITSATIGFTQADVGKSVKSSDALGSIVRYTSTIASVQSATQATMVDNATINQTNRYVHLYTDDTTALQAAITAAGVYGTIYLPHGAYYVSSGLTLLNGQRVIGERGGHATAGVTNRGSMIDATALVNSALFAVPANGSACEINGLYLQGPISASGLSTGSYGISAISSPTYLRIRDSRIDGFYRGVGLTSDQETLIEGCHVTGAKFATLWASASQGLMSIGNIWSNGQSGVAGGGNIVLVGACQGVTLADSRTDESFNVTSAGGSIVVENATDVTILTPLIFGTAGGNGVYVGASSARVHVKGSLIQPYNSQVAGQTIKIASGATGVVLDDVTTNANGGGDISDLGTGTVYRNVNGYTSGQKPTVTAISADTTLTAADSGKVFRVTGVDKVATLPATVAGLRYTFVVAAAALSSGTGFSISPNAADKIMGNGIASADDKDLVNTGATDAEGDTVTLVGDGVDGWYVEVMRGTWARQA
jgi:hypothetical protein